jgi:hypothetical protein
VPSPCRFPPPWTVEEIEACFIVKTTLSRCGQLVTKQNIGSKETAMPTRRFERIALAQLLVGGCAAAFSACVLIELAQAQPGYVLPPTPLPPPVVNPSSPNTVPQPSYRPITPSTPSITPTTPSTVPSVEVTSPANEERSNTTAQSEQSSVAKTHRVHHHHHYRGRHIGVGPSLGSFDCSYGWCVRISPPYAYYRPYGWYRY